MKEISSSSQMLNVSCWLLFVLGFLVLIPLHMGPPKMAEALLKDAVLEKFRYIVLLIAVVIFAVAMVSILKKLWPTLNAAAKAILIPLFLVVPISLWDYYDSFLFSDYLVEWIADGKKAGDFFPSFDFHELWRAIGRILLYVTAAWMSIILYKQSIIRKVTMVTLLLFCTISTGFCIAFLTSGPAFYFPCMVPAFAMAPAYWLGIVLLQRKRPLSGQ